MLMRFSTQPLLVGPTLLWSLYKSQEATCLWNSLRNPYWWGPLCHAPTREVDPLFGQLDQSEADTWISMPTQLMATFPTMKKRKEKGLSYRFIKTHRMREPALSQKPAFFITHGSELSYNSFGKKSCNSFGQKLCNSCNSKFYNSSQPHFLGFIDSPLSLSLSLSLSRFLYM